MLKHIIVQVTKINAGSRKTPATSGLSLDRQVFRVAVGGTTLEAAALRSGSKLSREGQANAFSVLVVWVSVGSKPKEANSMCRHSQIDSGPNGNAVREFLRTPSYGRLILPTSWTNQVERSVNAGESIPMFYVGGHSLLSTEAAAVEDANKEGELRVQEAYGTNYERLVVLERKFDPANLFCLNTNIKSSGKIRAAV